MGQNLYNYKTPKNKQEETHFFLTKGRITLKAFLLRFLFVLGLVFIYVIYKTLSNSQSFGLFDWLFFVLTSVFLAIQGVKRIHDVNQSGWYALIPIYNLTLLFSQGTSGDNDYGIDPNPQLKVTYFDELNDETNKQEDKNKKHILILISVILLVISAIVFLLWNKESDKEELNKNIYFCLPETLNVRSSKDESSKLNIVGNLRYGDSVEVISKVDPFWYEIKFNDESSNYVYKDYLINRDDFKLLQNFANNQPSFATLQSQQKKALLNILKRNGDKKLQYTKEGKNDTLFCEGASNIEYRLIYDKDNELYILKSLEQLEREEREKKNEVIRNWENYVSVSGSDYDSYWIGGISNLSITVTNNSDYTISSCSVEHDIIRSSGNIYKTINTHFYNIPPHSQRTKSIPNSEWGVEISDPAIYQINF